MKRIIRFINRVSMEPTLRLFWSSMATALIWAILFALTLLIVYTHQYPALIETVMSIGCIWGSNQLVGYTWFHPRPFVENAQIHPSITPARFSKSFPSDHAAISSVMATAVAIWFPPVASWFIVAALLVCAGRVIVGVHRMIDVIVGALGGVLITLAVHQLLLV